MSRLYPLLLLAAAAAAQPLRSPVAGRWGGELNVSQRAEPRTLNPVTAIDTPSRELIRLFLSDLVHINRETLRTEPALADSWRVSADGRGISVRLRQGVRFSDGAPLTPADVVFSFQAYLDEKLASPQRDLLLVGGKPPVITTEGDRTIRFRFAEPYAPAERLFDSVFILPRHKLEAAYRAGQLAAAWSVASGADLAGAGPFRLVSYQPGERAVFERNPHYWKTGAAGRVLPFLDRLQIRFLPDANAEALQFRGGALDLLTRIPAPAFRALQAALPAGEYQFHDAGTSLEYHFLFFNLNTAPPLPDGVAARQRWFRDPAFRSAVSLAVDREAILRLVFAGKAAPLWQPVGSAQGDWAHPALPKPPRDVEAARRLLERAGFRWNSGGALLDAAGGEVTFSIVTNAANAQHRQIATLLEQDLRALGIRLQVVPLEFRSLVDRILRTRDYDAAIMALAAGDADPGPEASVWLSSGRSHFWNLDPARLEPWEREIDELMRRQMTAVNRAERRRIYHRVQEIARRELPLICLASPNILTAARASLRNLRRNVLPPYALANADELYWEERR